MNPTATDLQSESDFVRQALATKGRHSLNFVLVGRTGVGKSSTINSLLGQEIAKTGDFEATTFEVKTYQGAINGFKYQVTDTPGLCDDLEEAGKDQVYLRRLSAKVPKADCLLFVSRLDDSRVSSDEKRAIKLLSETYGAAIWDLALIVFTHAGQVDPSDYSARLKKRSDLIRDEIAKYCDQAAAMPALAVDNKSPQLPNGKPWLGAFFTAVARRLSDEAFLHFVYSQAESLKIPQKGEPPPRIPLSPTERQSLGSRLQSAAEGAMIGAKIGGKYFGKPGALICGAIGFVCGFFS